MSRLPRAAATLLAFCTAAAAAAAQPAQAVAPLPAHCTVAAAPQPTQPVGPLLPRDSADAAVFRGGVVYANYCVTCHGINADGNGRAARLYDPRPANLRTSDKNDAYMLLIVRMGGQALARSEFMPPWGGELTEEQMQDVVAYLRSINARR